MNLENFIFSQHKTLYEKGSLSPEYLDLYSGIEDKNLREIFSSLHKRFENLFTLMNERLPTQDYQNHFWADPSRELIWSIDMVLDLKRALKNSKYDFDIDDYYSKVLEKCRGFLRRGGGSSIPENMEKVIIYYIEPIFKSKSSQKISRSNNTYHFTLKLIGEGSYAQVFKYKDDYYNKFFVLKRAKPELNAKEIVRFKREFDEMKGLNSPYIVEVYSFDESRNEYVMEAMDCSLDKFMEKENNKLTLEKRRNILLQILRAFGYLHTKNLLHRDISPKNILLKEYDHTVVVKVSDFGLVKTIESDVTSMNTDIKGYFNDPSLVTDGFDNYNILHETYALTKLVYYVMSGRTTIVKDKSESLNFFVHKGLNVDKKQRFQSISELTEAFRNMF